MAIFYSDDPSLAALGLSAVLVLVLLALRWIGVWRLYPYVLVGIALWFAVYQSGVHATLAGVAVGLIIPAMPPAQSVIDRSAAYNRALRESPTAERARLAVLTAESTIPANDRLERLRSRWWHRAADRGPGRPRRTPCRAAALTKVSSKPSNRAPKRELDQRTRPLGGHRIVAA